MTPLHICSEFLFTTINASPDWWYLKYVISSGCPTEDMVWPPQSGNVNLFDGVHFGYLHRTSTEYIILNYYNLSIAFIGSDSLLWIKILLTVCIVIALKRNTIPDLDAYSEQRSIVVVLFVDDSDTWLPHCNGITGVAYNLPWDRIALQTNVFPENYLPQDLNDKFTSMLFCDTGGCLLPTHSRQ